MINSLVQCFFLGFIITAIPGTVFIETVRRTMVNRESVVIFLLGNVVGVTLTVTIVVLGLTNLTAQSHISASFYAVSGLTLILIGVRSLAARPDLRKKRAHNKWEHGGKASSFQSGFVLATVNPASIAFWIVMIGRFVSVNSSFAEVVASVVSINFGAIACYIVLVSLVSRYKARLSNRHLVVLSRAFGGIIVAYGIMSLFKGLGILS